MELPKSAQAFLVSPDCIYFGTSKPFGDIRPKLRRSTIYLYAFLIYNESVGGVLLSQIKVLYMKSYINNFFLLITSIGVCFILGELVCRVSFLSPHEFTTPRKDMRISNNPILLYELTPDIKNGRNKDGFQSAGLKEIVRNKRKDVLRIMVLGDSIIQGYGVSRKSNVTTILQQNLEKEGLNVEVINAGVSGYNTLQEVEQFRVKGVYYEPDIVVIGFCFNDAVINSSELYVFNKEYNEELKKHNKNMAFPFQEKRHSEVFNCLLEHSKLFKSLYQLVETRIRNVNYKDAFMKLAEQNQKDYRSKETNSSRLESLSLENEKHIQELNISKKEFIAQNWGNYYASWALDKTESINAWPRVVYACDLLKKVIGQRNIRVIVMIFPMLIDYKAYAFEKTNAFFDAEFKDMGFNVLDLLPYFKEHDVKEVSVGDTIHPNSLGHKIAADRLSDRILEMIKK